MPDEIIQPFVNIPPVQPTSEPETPPNTWQVGFGQYALKIDKQGMWFGAEKYADAPWKVNMQGVMEAAGFLTVATTLDQIADGSTYKRVLSTSISGGKIILSQTLGNLDDIPDGASYGRPTFAQLTGASRGYYGLDGAFSIIKGYITNQLSAVGMPYNGVRVDVNGIYGAKNGAITFYINTNGDAYFAGTIAASAIYGSYIQGTTIEGSIYRSAPPGSPRVEIHTSDASRVSFFDTGEVIGGKIRLTPGMFQFWGQAGYAAQINGEIIYLRAPNGAGVICNVEELQSQSGGGIYFHDSPRAISDGGVNLGSPGRRWNKLILAPRSSDPAGDDGSLYLYRSGTTYRLRAFLNGGWRSVTLT